MAMIRVARRFSRDRMSVTFLEVVIAARTDPELGERLLPKVRAHDDMVAASVELHPTVAELKPAERDVWLHLMRSVLQIEALVEPVDPKPELDDAKSAALVALVGHAVKRR